MRPLGFPARLRIKQRRDFLRVQRRGRKHHVRHFMVFVLPRSETEAKANAKAKPERESAPDSNLEGPPVSPPPLPTRLGVTVTRKVGNAVTRNRIKRLVREIFRQHRARLPPGLDMVWVAKQQAADATYAQVLDDFEALLRRGELTGPRAQRRSSPQKGQTGQAGQAGHAGHGKR